MNRKTYILYLFSVASWGIALPACSSPTDNSPHNIIGEPSGGCQGLNVPKVIDGSEYEQWHLLINKSGLKEWNGQDVDTATLRRYMEELSKMPTDVGKLTIHIEPETSCRTILEIQKIVDSSPLCVQRRCVQDRWDYERPIVN